MQWEKHAQISQATLGAQCMASCCLESAATIQQFILRILSFSLYKTLGLGGMGEVESGLKQGKPGWPGVHNVDQAGS